MFNTTAPMGNFGYGFGQQGMVPNQAAMPKTGNWLPTDKYQLLRKGLQQFKLSVTEEELAKGQCNHYNPDGTSALVPDQDGSGGCTCLICGTHFNSTDYSQQDVTTATQNILDILNTIKIMYLSLDPSAALEYFQIIPFIEKIPQLYNIAVNDFKKYEGIENFQNAPSQNPFNIFSAMINPGFGMGYYAQPQMYQQPMMNAQQAPAAAPMGQPVAPGFNPIYGAPAMQGGYVPQMQGYQMNPGFNSNMPVQPQAAPAPTAAPAAEGKDVKVGTEFKK